MFTPPAVDVVGLADRAGQRGHFAKGRSRVRGLPEFGGEWPVAVLAEEMETPGPGQVRALVTVAGNPVLSTPNGVRLERALAGLEFMVSIDPYLNETSRHAHLVLPPVVAAGARSLRRRLPPARRAQHGAVLARPLRGAAGRTRRLADPPRPGRRASRRGTAGARSHLH